MGNINFGKPVQDLTEDELFGVINNSIPAFGNLAQYELLRRLAFENSRSSKRYAKWSLFSSIVAIGIALIIGGLQIYLAKIQVDPILDAQYRAERNIYELCKEPGNWKVSNDFGPEGTLTCKDIYIKLRVKFGTYPPAEYGLNH